jgi:hypothetical protein
MVFNFTDIVALPGQNMFGRQVVITPIVSQPTAGAYGNRGIYITSPVDVLTEAGIVFSDQKTMLKIRLAEYPVPPAVKDRVFIPAEANYPQVGDFEIQDTDVWADGVMMLTLRKLAVEPQP